MTPARNLCGWLIGLAVFLTGCASSSVEPGLIVLRNSATHDLRSMAAAEVAKDPASAIRFGSVSPLLTGRDMAFGRESDAPPLPRTTEIRWIDYKGVHSTVVPIRQAVRVATGVPEEALVFDLQKDGTVMVYLELYVR